MMLLQSIHSLGPAQRRDVTFYSGGLTSTGDITVLLKASAEGDGEAHARLIESLYSDLRRLAGHMMRQERSGHTLQATALVNELMLKLLVNENGLAAENKKQLMSSAAIAMRRLLVDHARGKQRGKRGGGEQVIPIQTELNAGVDSGEQVLLINDAMERLQQKSQRAGEVAELKIFGGFSIAEIAEALDVTTRTVDRDWLFAKAWLQTQLR